MIIGYEDVTAIIPTRGDVDLKRVRATLPYSNVIVQESGPETSVFARYLAIEKAPTPYIFFQDDDIVFTAHDRLLACHSASAHCSEWKTYFTSNMPSPWWEEQYRDNKMALVGAGSLVPRDLPWAAFGRYLALYPKDQLFLDYCDMVHGIFTEYRRWDLGYEILPHASAPGRIYTTPGAAARKQSMIDRCLEIRARV